MDLEKELSLTQRLASNTSVLVSPGCLGGADAFLNTIFSHFHLLHTILRLTLQAVLQLPCLASILELQGFQEHIGPRSPWSCLPRQSLLLAGILYCSQSYSSTDMK